MVKSKVGPAPGTPVLAVVLEALESGAKWVPAGSVREGAAGHVPTLHSHLLEALGCDSKAGALAYWDWVQIHELLARCWSAIGEVVGPKADLWSNASDRTLAEVVAALRSASADALVPAAPFERRPWSTPTVLRTCRIPFVPVASVVQIWLNEQEPLDRLLARLVIDRLTDPWGVLRAADPVARGMATPDDLRPIAESVRHWMLESTPAQFSPSVALHAVAEVFTTPPNIEDLDQWAKAADPPPGGLVELSI